jgi:localization factor PodJL
VPDSTLSPSTGEPATTHVIRCAECHELVPADRVRHREERVKAAARPAPGRWRSGGPPIFQPTAHGPRVASGARPPAPSPHSAYAIERIPVCVDCLRRQRMGLYGVCGIAAACLVAAIFLYTRQAGAPSRQDVALQTPVASREPTPVKPPAAPPAAEKSTEPLPVWAKAATPLQPPVVTPPPTPHSPAAAPSTPVSDTPASPAPEAATAQSAPPDASPTETAAASPEPPIWQSDREPAPRKVAKATPPARHARPAANALALRNSGYAALAQRHYREALTLLQQATMMGDAYAPMYIGQIFESGIGVPRDVGQASYWYGIAIDRGNSVALTAFNRMRASPY